jgi:hypothetical protein
MFLGNGTINSDIKMEHVMPHHVNNESTAGNGVFMRSMPIATSCKNRKTERKGVLCWVRPKAISQGPSGQHQLQVAFKIPYVYDYITELCSTQAEVILNRVNPNVCGIGQEARHRKY